MCLLADGMCVLQAKDFSCGKKIGVNYTECWVHGSVCDRERYSVGIIVYYASVTGGAFCFFSDYKRLASSFTYL